MATTTNYGWTTPDDTALVKDGASAIRTLGSSVDTTTKALNPSTTLGDIEYRSSTTNTNTRLGIGSTGQVLTVAGGVPSWATPATPASGLTLINTTSFSAVSSFAPANGTFSATYDNYRVIISGITTASGTQSFTIRYRATGTDNTTANYYSQRLTGDVAAANADNTTGGTSFLVSYGGSGGNSSLYMDFSNPFAAKKGEILCFANGWITGQGNILKMATMSFDDTTSFDSFSLIVGGSTFSGVCQVYGYQQ